MASQNQKEIITSPPGELSKMYFDNLILKEKTNNLDFLTSKLNEVKLDVLKIISKENNIELSDLKKEFNVE